MTNATKLLSHFDFKVGKTIRITRNGRKNGVSVKETFTAKIMKLDDRRLEYKSSGHEGGFALPVNSFNYLQVEKV